MCEQHFILRGVQVIPDYQSYQPFNYYHFTLCVPNFNYQSPTAKLQQMSCQKMSQPNQVKIEEEPDEMNQVLPKLKKSRFKYPKKNVESNVVNQCLSFLITKSKSHLIISRILNSTNKINDYYKLVKNAKKGSAKYMGRYVLQNLMQLADDHPVYILYKKLKPSLSLKLNQVKKVLKMMVNYFLKNVIAQAILTSSKLDKTTIKDHLSRARQIYKHLNLIPGSNF